MAKPSIGANSRHEINSICRKAMVVAKLSGPLVGKDPALVTAYAVMTLEMIHNRL